MPKAEVRRNPYEYSWNSESLLSRKLTFRCSNAQMRSWELSGGALRCPKCGRALIAVSVWKGYTRKDGTRTRHFHYACATRRQKGKEACSYSRTPNARKIEAEVWEAVKAVLLDPERLERGLTPTWKLRRRRLGRTPRRRHRHSRTGSPRLTARGLPIRIW